MPKTNLNLLAPALFAFLLISAQPSFAASPPEPPHLQMTPAQMITPADFTPIEANYYKTLDPAAQRDFIATRSFVRVSQQVVDETLPASQLPDRPAGFSAKYLLTGDPFDINGALADYFTAAIGGEGNLMPRMTVAQMLQPSDLTPEELTFSRTLNAADAKHFMITRSYVRLCQRAVDQKLPLDQLPTEPHGMRGAYLLKGDEDQINKAEDLSFHYWLKRYPDAADRLFGVKPKP